jgi:tRNA threonylcarbamoyladenosine biosynthesis protein TsaE
VNDPGPLPWDLVLRDEAETEQAGAWLAPLLRAGDVVRLSGELGAGKTTFTRGLARGLGADPAAVHSPSFSLVHVYRDATGRTALTHVDLYRVEGAADLREIGLEDALGAEAPAAVEWAERLGEGRFGPRAGDLMVALEVIPSGGRRLRVGRL